MSSEKETIPECYYFGIQPGRSAGHYLHDRDFNTGRHLERLLPFRYSILDCGLLPQQGENLLGMVCRTVVNGWTIISFYDNSGDSRPGSCSVFVIKGEWCYGNALNYARSTFPSVFSRIKFDLRPHESTGY